MNDVFADTSYFLAVLNPADRDHARALRTARDRPGRLVPTAWVMVETANAMSRADLRHLFLRMFDRLQARPENVIVPAEQSWLDEGVALYRQRPDKDWSLTDCTSFVVMNQMRIVDALTADHHFQQAGFRALLLDA